MHSHQKIPLRAVGISQVTLKKNAFTLIELLMVMVVIVILVAITFGISRSVKYLQNHTRVEAELAMIRHSLEQFKIKNGDYPWTSSDVTPSASDYGEILFQALVGWKKFSKKGGPVKFESKKASEVPTNGPKGFVDISKLTYAKLESPEVLNPEVDFSSLPTGYAFLNPWGKPYWYRYFEIGHADRAILGYQLSAGDK